MYRGILASEVYYGIILIIYLFITVSLDFNSTDRSLFVQTGGWLFSADDIHLCCLFCLSPLHPGLCHEQDMPGLHAYTHHQPTYLHSLHCQVENSWR